MYDKIAAERYVDNLWRKVSKEIDEKYPIN